MAITIDLKVTGAQQMASVLGDASKRLQGAGAKAQSLARTRKKQPATPMEAFMKVMSSARFGKGGIFPLVGQTLKALESLGGPGAAIAKVGLQFLVLEKMVEAVITVLKNAADAVNQFSKAQLTAGASDVNAGKLAALGGALGLSGQDMADLSRRLSDRMVTDPMTRAYAAKLGVADMIGPYGKLDKSQNLLPIVEGLRKLTDPQAIRAARAMGVEELLPLRKLSSGTMQELRGDASVSSRVNNQETQQTMLEFTTQLGRLSSAFGDLKTSVLDLIVPAITEITEGLTGFLRIITISIEGWKLVSESLFTFAQRFLHLSDDKEYKRQLERLQGELGKLTKLGSSADQASDSLNDFAYQIDSLGRKIKGGGPMAQGAVPAGWRYWTNQNNYRMLAMGMGAF